MIDLHSHSTCSDGRLSPTELLDRAAACGVTTLALTDHDTTDGLAEAQTAAVGHGIDLVAGVEISVTWQRRTLHIVGLCFDPQSAPLVRGLQGLQHTRRERARAMGDKLAKVGVDDAFNRAAEYAGTGQIGRNHFARVLIDAGFCDTFEQAFKRYLKLGRSGYVGVQWAGLDEATGWIHAAGGLAVLAHPLGYRFSGAWRRRMTRAFAEAGGDAVEICTGTTRSDDITLVARDAAQHDLYGSAGSDFHSPEQHWLELGCASPLPSHVAPVWQAASFSVMSLSADST